MILKSGLYIVSTPIGNLNDISIRALEVLKNSDIIFCEDTRVSNKLLVKHKINVPLRVYNDNSDVVLRTHISKLILEGKIISLISDAGTPLISDPGYKLVRDLKKDGLYIDIVPGACAAIAALTLSGLPSNSFIFLGFLPKTQEAKNIAFDSVKNLDCTLIFYETSKRLVKSLIIAKEVLGDRMANIGRELTKLYQESRSDLLSNLINYYTEAPPKGEIVITIHGTDNRLISIKELHAEINELISNQNFSAKSASDLIFNKYQKNFSRKDIYKIANELKKR